MRYELRRLERRARLVALRAGADRRPARCSSSCSCRSPASLARRLRRGQQEREALLRRALDASETERRRIAADLHDGVVQDLAGVVVLARRRGERARAATHERADASSAAPRRATATERPRTARRCWSRSTRRTCTAAGLAAALADLVAGARRARHRDRARRRRRTSTCPSELEALLFRAAQEAIRNVVAHAEREHVDADRAARNDGRAALAVERRRRGFVPDRADAAQTATSGCACSPTWRATPAAARRSTPSPGAGTRIALEVPPMIRVLVVEDHAVVRAGPRGAARGADDIEVVGAAADGAEAVELAAPSARRRADGPLDARSSTASRRPGGSAPPRRGPGRGADLVLRPRPDPRGARRRRDRLPAQGRRAGRAPPRHPRRRRAASRRSPRRRARRCSARARPARPARS